MALLWENHEHHTTARSWFRGVAQFATCPVSQLGFARVSSHPLLGYSLSLEQAFGVLRRFLTDPRHRFIPDNLSCEDRVVRTDRMGGANQITDHYLAAMARQHGLTLATFDQPLVKALASEGDLVVLIG
jgi:toxin-antitoxin system PIN domain toxin